MKFNKISGLMVSILISLAALGFLSSAAYAAYNKDEVDIYVDFCKAKLVREAERHPESADPSRASRDMDACMREYLNSSSANSSNSSSGNSEGGIWGVIVAVIVILALLIVIVVFVHDWLSKIAKKGELKQKIARMTPEELEAWNDVQSRYARAKELMSGWSDVTQISDHKKETDPDKLIDCLYKISLSEREKWTERYERNGRAVRQIRAERIAEAKGESYTGENDKEFLLESFKRQRPRGMVGYELNSASDELKNDKEVVLAAVIRDSAALDYASSKLKDDKEVVLAAVRANSEALQYASNKLKNDKEVVLTAIAQGQGDGLKYAGREIRDDKEVVLAAVVYKDWAELQYASTALKGDKEVALTAVRACCQNLEYVSTALKNDKEVALAAVAFCDDTVLEHVSVSLRNDRDVVLVAVKACPDNLGYASATLRNDKEIVLAAVAVAVASQSKAEDGDSVWEYPWEYVGKTLMKDRQFVLDAVNICGWALEYACATLRNDKEVALAAVKNFYRAFEHASEKLRLDKEVVLAAAGQSKESLKYIRQYLKKNKLPTVDLDGLVLNPAK